ncbi:MAG: hypothetical protein ACR2IQ_02190 [Minisyncoccia bacterium]
MSRKMIKNASYYSITLCLTVMLLCSGAFAVQVRVVREVSNTNESTMAVGGTCSSSTVITNVDRNTTSALLSGTSIKQPVPEPEETLCSGKTTLLSVSYNSERTRAPPVNI